ncbi:N-6 DNA methylase [Deinococcus murrayi]|uniref:N-6 DNA methylase n=1 Tax=Deinococcus murrayi TaxID=68910 RepID=UPI000688C378|nr:N-6 DNA methylase [Deinococcus murrayi]
MPALETPLRKILEKQVIAARDTAEAAAEAALARLLVDNSGGGALGHLSDDERKLRKALLAKQRQLGSREALVRECAYEQWHAMLFARFLEAAGLLMHPDGVSVTMDDLAELAQEEGDPDAYATAARYAAQMLPGIFRPSDPLLRVRFAPEHRQRLEALIEGIPKPAFTADDALGWVYQFWQTARKQQVNASGRKIGGADISPVTQLFTEHYMVQFMLHNTIGAWWTARHPETPLPTEKSYLRLNEDGTPAAGTFPGWPATVRELKVLDPCCGSGHFLVAAFALLRRLRMLEEGLSEREAADAVLRDNLYGLELDPRCTQLAAFNLTLEAWKAGGYRKLPPLNIACSGLSIGAGVEDWLPFAENGDERNILKALHAEFQNAPDLGSLLNPRTTVDSFGMYGQDMLDTLPGKIERVLSREQAQDPAAAIHGENVQGVARAARLLGDTYHLVITNVPYLARGKQGDILKNFIERRHPEAKADLATAFVERARDFTKPGGTYSLVTPQNWLFLGSYKRLREGLLKEQQWDWVARLGTGAFETISGEVVNVSLVTLTNQTPANTHQMLGLDASEGRSVDAKDAALREGKVVMLGQEGQRGNPDSAIILEKVSELPLLSKYAKGLAGVLSGDSSRFEAYFWEFTEIGSTWEFQQSTVREQIPYGGRQGVLRWEKGKGQLHALAEALKERLHDAHERGNAAWGKKGVAVSQMRDLPATIYTGEFFDCNAAVILPHKEEYSGVAPCNFE